MDPARLPFIPSLSLPNTYTSARHLQTQNLTLGLDDSPAGGFGVGSPGRLGKFRRSRVPVGCSQDSFLLRVELDRNCKHESHVCADMCVSICPF